MQNVERLLTTDRPYLTDAGFETWMFFVEGYEAPEFAALVLMDDDDAKAAMRRYFDRYLGMAEQAGVGFVLDTNTWRGCVKWAPKLGMSEKQILRLSRDAVSFAHDICKNWASKVSPIIVNGVVGPAGDGYSSIGSPDAAQAQAFHTPQINVLIEAGIDMVSALTISNSAEAIGITRAATVKNVPVAISFTVETDGRLPSGETLDAAITATDAATNDSPIYYMVNCAHPDHFRDVLKNDTHAMSRIGGIRANASRLSHAELDASEVLDDGDPTEFGPLYAELQTMLPGLRVVGGCCGTDHRHVGCVSDYLHRKSAA